MTTRRDKIVVGIHDDVCKDVGLAMHPWTSNLVLGSYIITFTFIQSTVSKAIFLPATRLTVD